MILTAPGFNSPYQVLLDGRPPRPVAIFRLLFLLYSFFGFIISFFLLLFRLVDLFLQSFFLYILLFLLFFFFLCFFMLFFFILFSFLIFGYFFVFSPFYI